jgi:hypothetical protein
MKLSLFMWTRIICPHWASLISMDTSRPRPPPLSSPLLLTPRKESKKNDGESGDESHVPGIWSADDARTGLLCGHKGR